MSKYIQKKTPKLIAAEAGNCLWFVQESFAVAHVYDYARQQWDNARYRHTGKPPSGLYVPIYFSWSGDLNNGWGYFNYGHYAYITPNGRVISSPLAGIGRLEFGSISECEIAFGCKYVGWSEDVGDQMVIDEKIEHKNMYMPRVLIAKYDLKKINIEALPNKVLDKNVSLKKGDGRLFLKKYIYRGKTYVQTENDVDRNIKKAFYLGDLKDAENVITTIFKQLRRRIIK